ncbi:MAG: thiamine pyrophosphate-dependent enzyme, partial [Ignavibacteriaceae bacterium]|nr:thiamine pyrophosphate-dependent enzyme [Ignavibacteriaceae bacterium]
NKCEIPNLITNYDSFLHSDNFIRVFKPKFIIHFGRPLTSPRFEKLTANKSVKIFIVNKYGDFRFRQAINYTIDSDESVLLKILTSENFNKDTGLILNEIKNIDLLLERLKNNILFNTNKINEVQIISEVLTSISPNSNVMIGNSVPIRDLDFFTSSLKKDVNVYQNRGASGIDGIISTASGIASLSKTPTYLIIGDLSFYYDINSLLTIKKLKIPLLIILINNNGGAIFKFLPIARSKKVLDKFFLTPTNLNFGKIVQAFGIDYREIKTKQELINHLKVSAVRKQPVVFEIKTNSDYSLSLRNKFWKMAVSTIDNHLRKYEI